MLDVGNLEEIRGPAMFKEADTSGPSPELDAAWDKLIDERKWPRFIDSTAQTNPAF